MSRKFVFIYALIATFFCTPVYADRYFPTYIKYVGLDSVDIQGRSLLEHEWRYTYTAFKWWKPLQIARKTNTRLGHTIDKHVQKSTRFLIDRCGNGRNQFTTFRALNHSPLVIEKKGHELAGNIIKRALIDNHLVLDAFANASRNAGSGPSTAPPVLSVSLSDIRPFYENNLHRGTATMGGAIRCNQHGPGQHGLIGVMNRSVRMTVGYRSNATNVIGGFAGWFLVNAFPL